MFVRSQEPTKEQVESSNTAKRLVYVCSVLKKDIPQWVLVAQGDYGHATRNQELKDMLAGILESLTIDHWFHLIYSGIEHEALALEAWWGEYRREKEQKEYRLHQEDNEKRFQEIATKLTAEELDFLSKYYTGCPSA